MERVQPKVLVDRVGAVGVEGVVHWGAVCIRCTVASRVLVSSCFRERGWGFKDGGKDGVGVEAEDSSVWVIVGKGVDHSSEAVIEVCNIKTLERLSSSTIDGGTGREVDRGNVQEKEVTGTLVVELYKKVLIS